MNGSGMLLWAVIATVPLCISAVKWPSANAPIATRCSVGVRPPTMRYKPSRDSVTRTGRPTSFAATAPNIWVRQALGAEATADVRRDHAHLLGLEVKHAGDRRRLGSDHLRRVMNGEFVAIPYDRSCLWLDRVVIVPRRAIDMVDFVGRRREHRLGIADLGQQRLTHEHARLRPRRLCRGERGRRWLGRIGRDNQ